MAEDHETGKHDLKEQLSVGVSRRSFLKGAAVVAAGGAATALAACAPTDNETGGSNANAGGNSAAGITWDRETDMVVVGAGGGVYGALAAHAAGKEVLVLEKTMLFGGTTSLSGGEHWTPCNLVMKELGQEDNRADAIAYITKVANGHATQELIEAYVDKSPAFLEWTRDELKLEWTSYGDGHHYQDYFDIPGCREIGRGVQVDIVKSTKNIKNEDVEAPSGLIAPFEFQLLRYLVEERGIEVLYETTAKRLYKDDNGKIVGILATDSSGKELKIGVRSGVLLAAGGFDNNNEMRAQYLYAPIYYTRMTEASTGDGHRMGMEVGADLANMSAVYGQDSWVPPQADGNIRLGQDRADSGGVRGLPYSLIVNKKGRRIADESGAYGTFQQLYANWDNSTFSWANIPLYWIGDQNFVDRYGIQTNKPGEVIDEVFKADTLEEIARHYEIDSAALVAEVAKFNGYAATGVDPEFHRGEFIFDRNSVADNNAGLINGCLGPVEKAPFYACTLWPGSVGTSGGLRINGNAQVLNTSGEIIPGLYACGCNAASFAGMSYCGGGTAVGSTCVFGWVAGSHLASL
jgi:succinate dehydrogenase/fumarate reductase flavoprotein subunit